MVMLVLMATGLEALLNLAALISPKAKQMLAPSWSSPPASIPDNLLGHRPNPSAHGHDSNGFRNHKALVRAPMVVLGGSQAYGMNVDSSQAWPTQLSHILFQPVYNMSFGGYGPPHFDAMIPEALKLEPRIIFSDFCSANDLFDCYAFFYERQKTIPGASVAANPHFKAEPLSGEISGFSVQSKENAPAEGMFSLSLIRWIKDHSKTIGMLRRLREEVGNYAKKSSPDKEWQEALDYARKRVPGFERFESHGLRTLFRPSYRIKGLDLQDPRVKEGQRLAHETLLHTSKTLAEKKIRFMLILIPSKEYSFAPLLGPENAAAASVAEKEEQIFVSLIEFLKVNQIEFIDLRPILREELKSGHAIYFSNHDDHFNALGHTVVARHIASYLTSSPAK